MITKTVSTQPMRQASEQVAKTVITTNIKRVSMSCSKQYFRSLKTYFVSRLGGDDFLKLSGKLLRQTMMAK